MKHFKNLFLIAVMCIALFVPGCTSPQKEGRSVLDMAGHNVIIYGNVDRVVALTAADCEIVCALGCQDKLVGRGEYCDYPVSIIDVSAVSSGVGTNVEQIIALRPQVVFMGSMDQTQEQYEQLLNAGITVVMSDADTIDGVYYAIQMIGTVLDKEAEADTIVSDMQKSFSELKRGVNSKTIYFELSPLEWGLWTAGSGTFMNEIANLLGLTNIFNDVDGWVEVSEEQVISRNPDYIVTISPYYGDGPTPIEEILNRQGWDNITAVKNKAILNLVDNELSRPSPRLVDGAKALKELID